MLPSGMPEISMQVSLPIDKPEAESSSGEVQFAATKMCVAPVETSRQVFLGDLSEESGNPEALRGVAGIKDRGCRLVKCPEFIKVFTTEAAESCVPPTGAVCSYGEVKKQESEHGTLSQLEDLALLMGFAKSLGLTASTAADSASPAGSLHPVVEKFVYLYDSEGT